MLARRYQKRMSARKKPHENSTGEGAGWPGQTIALPFGKKPQGRPNNMRASRIVFDVIQK